MTTPDTLAECQAYCEQLKAEVARLIAQAASDHAYMRKAEVERERLKAELAWYVAEVGRLTALLSDEELCHAATQGDLRNERSEVERLQGEVISRNARALEGDEAIRVREGLVDQIDELMKGRANLRAENARLVAEVEELSRTGLDSYMTRQRRWSMQTFGPGARRGGIVKHIRKELDEVLASPDDPREWLDVVALALDGYWRSGGTAVARDLYEVQQRNMRRRYPPPASEDDVSEHEGGHSDRIAKLRATSVSLSPEMAQAIVGVLDAALAGRKP